MRAFKHELKNTLTLGSSGSRKPTAPLGLMCFVTFPPGVCDHQLHSAKRHWNVQLASTHQKSTTARVVIPLQVGNISVHPGPPTKPTIVNLYGQIAAGRPQPGGDSAANREHYFQRALQAFSLWLRARYSPGTPGNRAEATVAIPWKIGCGLARGIGNAITT